VADAPDEGGFASSAAFKYGSASFAGFLGGLTSSARLVETVGRSFRVKGEFHAIPADHSADVDDGFDRDR